VSADRSCEEGVLRGRRGGREGGGEGRREMVDELWEEKTVLKQIITHKSKEEG